MQLVKTTPFEVSYLLSRARGDRVCLSVVAKATFAMAADGVCALAPTQLPCSDEVRHGSDPRQSLRLDSDLAPLKARCECFVLGSCHAPGARPTGVSGVAFKIGDVSKALAVFGDRYWTTKMMFRAASDPVPFTVMPLRWERSFGGPDVPTNPYGVGTTEVATTRGPRRVLPNIEDPRELIASPDARPRPAGSFPIARETPARARLARFRAAERPGELVRFPPDFDWSYFNAAPADQQRDGAWRGDEHITLRNLHPRHEVFRTTLPGLRARCFVDDPRAAAGTSPFTELPLALDTITVDADGGAVLCLWRGMIEVRGEDVADVGRLFVMHEPLGERRAREDYRDLFEHALAAAGGGGGVHALGAAAGPGAGAAATPTQRVLPPTKAWARPKPPRDAAAEAAAAATKAMAQSLERLASAGLPHAPLATPAPGAPPAHPAPSVPPPAASPAPAAAPAAAPPWPPPLPEFPPRGSAPPPPGSAAPAAPAAPSRDRVAPFSWDAPAPAHPAFAPPPPPPPFPPPSAPSAPPAFVAPPTPPGAPPAPPALALSPVSGEAAPPALALSPLSSDATPVATGPLPDFLVRALKLLPADPRYAATVVADDPARSAAGPAAPVINPTIVPLEPPKPIAFPPDVPDEADDRRERTEVLDAYQMPTFVLGPRTAAPIPVGGENVTVIDLSVDHILEAINGPKR